jgi:hypothetical protein
MVCQTCGPIAQCTCPDCDERLKDVAFGPRYKFLMFKWCRTCDKHYARCRCETPAFYIVSGGTEIPVSARGFETVTGERVVPDLEKR